MTPVRSGVQPLDEKGSSLIEFALAAPLCLLLVFAILHLGGAEVNRMIVHLATYQGTRAAAVADDDPVGAADGRVRQVMGLAVDGGLLFDLPTSDQLTVRTEERGGNVGVRVIYDAPILIGAIARVVDPIGYFLGGAVQRTDSAYELPLEAAHQAAPDSLPSEVRWVLDLFDAIVSGDEEFLPEGL